MVLNVYIRQDLKMRKGKMAAQAAHAAMKLLFEVMKKTSQKMSLEPLQADEFFAFLKNPVINIKLVTDEMKLRAALDQTLPFSEIIDSGRTEFHGIPTLTCAAQGIFSACDTRQHEVPAAYGRDIKAKQVFVFHKDLPLPKELACELSVLSCLTLLESKLKKDAEEPYFDTTEVGAFVDWILNAFAKIGLSTPTLEGLEKIEQQLSQKGIAFTKVNKGGHNCLCTEPCYSQDVDPITGSLSLI